MQSGAALISILILLAFVSFLSVELSKNVQFQISLEGNATDKEQAYWYALGTERHIVLRLKERLYSDEETHDQNPVKLHYHFPFDQGEIRSQLRPLRSCFNLNVLSQAEPERGGKGLLDKEVQRLDRLLQLKGISNVGRAQLLERLMDWLDQDNDPLGMYGREDADYMQANEPYRAGNTQLASLDELFSIGVSGISLDLKSLLCVLPLGAGNQISVNQLESAELLVSMSLGYFSMAQAKVLIDQRPAKGYAAYSELLETLGWKDEPEFLRQIIRIEPSEYYELNSAVVFRQAHFIMKSILWIKQDSSRVIQRQYGALQ